jgi:ABC-type transport system involved in multi-copper enzyme maturation permease subunit
MRWLLWKDYRNNRLVVIAALCFLLVPHLLALSFSWRGVSDGPDARLRWAEIFFASSLYGFCIAQVVIALVGGNAIAGERVDRSAEFLASLPIPRGRILVSKLLLAVAIIAVIWLTDGLALWYTMKLLYQHRGIDYAAALSWLATAAITAMTFFCVAWCLSAFLSSAVIAVCGGLVAPLIAISTPMFIAYLLGSPMQDFDPVPWFRGICLTLAPICFGLGTWHYLRRVEP